MTQVTFKLNPSDEPDLTDDEYVVFVDGVKVPFGIQICGREYAVNEYPIEGKEEDFWVKEHGIHRALTKAKLEATTLALAHIAAK